MQTYDWRADCALLTAPALIISGEDDWVPPEGPLEWARCLPDARILQLEGASHAPWLERPEVVLPAIDTFLSGHWPADATTLDSASGSGGVRPQSSLTRHTTADSRRGR